MADSFFTELKRRNVFRVAAIYLVVGWLLLQVGDVLFPALRLPEWTATLLVAFLILGLPIALVFAWAFELTPEGVVRTEKVPREQSITAATGQKFNHVIIAVLAVAVVVLLLRMFVFHDHGVAPAVDVSERSIAVLPFKNQSASEENAEFFSGGLHDELLTLLSRIGDLKVISRTSVERLDPGLSIREIGALLGVATVLEGQVQRAGNRLRINVQLIDTAEEGHLWANTYDSKLTAENVFEVQGDIARTIANALQAELSPEEQRALDSIGTQNLEALERYLSGMHIAKVHSFAALEEAVAELTRATELDPDFAQAWVGLAKVYSRQFGTGSITSQAYFAATQAAIDKAMQLDRGSPVLHSLQGSLHQWAGDDEAAETSFREALRLNPNDSDSLAEYGRFLRDSGRPSEALVVLKRAVAIDPLSAEVCFQLGKAHMHAGDREHALEMADRIEAIDPTDVRAYGLRVQAYIWFGRYDLAYPAYLGALAADPGDYEGWASIADNLEVIDHHELADRYLAKAESLGRNQPSVLRAAALIQYMRGDFDAAYDVSISALRAGLDNRWGSDGVFLRIVRDRALETGEYDEVTNLYRVRYPGLFASPPQLNNFNIFYAADVALLLQHSGQADAADTLVKAALDWRAHNHPDGVYGYEFGVIQAELLALDGQRDAALQELRRAVDSGWTMHWEFYLGGDNFDTIRDEPAFQSIRQRLESEMAKQHEALTAIPHLGEYDFRDGPGTRVPL